MSNPIDRIPEDEFQQGIRAGLPLVCLWYDGRDLTEDQDVSECRLCQKVVILSKKNQCATNKLCAPCVVKHLGLKE